MKSVPNTPRIRFVLRPYRRIPTWYSSYYMSGNVIGKGVVKNLSRTGLRVLGDHSLTPGTDVCIRLHLGETGPPLEISRATVRWADQYECGLNSSRLTRPIAWPVSSTLTSVSALTARSNPSPTATPCVARLLDASSKP